VAPAHERLGTCHDAAAEADDRLVLETELAPLDSVLEVSE
jgi:hypothetical protein